MKIPKRFKLFGHYIEVIINERLEKDASSWGLSKYGDKEIVIEKSLSNSMREQTFCHELVHSILEHMGENELGNKEQFVNTFSELLYQALETME